MKRRDLLTCGIGALCLTALPKISHSLDLARLGDDVGGSDLRALAGSQVRATGFALPHVSGQTGFFVLSGSPSSVCPHCRPDGGAAFSDLFVYPRTNGAFGNGVWEGRLDVGAMVDPDTGTLSLARLYGAERLTD